MLLNVVEEKEMKMAGAVNPSLCRKPRSWPSISKEMMDGTRHSCTQG